MGHSRRFADVCGTSAHPPIADMRADIICDATGQEQTQSSFVLTSEPSLRALEHQFEDQTA
jgi:hypothetical protein